MSADEVVVKDLLGRNARRVSVDDAHRKGLWHEAVYLYVTDGHHVMQRRVLEDPCAYGGVRPVWDMSLLVGDILANETPDETVERIANDARMRLKGLQKLKLVTLTEHHQRDARGRSYCHRTVDHNYVLPCSALSKIDDHATRFYPIKKLLDDTCHSLRHEASFGHVHRGPNNREIYDKILTILARTQ